MAIWMRIAIVQRILPIFGDCIIRDNRQWIAGRAGDNPALPAL